MDGQMRVRSGRGAKAVPIRFERRGRASCVSVFVGERRIRVLTREDALVLLNVLGAPDEVVDRLWALYRTPRPQPSLPLDAWSSVHASEE